jgi:hypothetical protein
VSVCIFRTITVKTKLLIGLTTSSQHTRPGSKLMLFVKAKTTGPYCSY